MTRPSKFVELTNGEFMEIRNPSDDPVKLRLQVAIIANKVHKDVKYPMNIVDERPRGTWYIYSK